MTLSLTTRRINENTKHFGDDVHAVECDGIRVDTITLTADGWFSSMDTMPFGCANLGANLMEIRDNMQD